MSRWPEVAYHTKQAARHAALGALIAGQVAVGWVRDRVDPGPAGVKADA